MNRRKLELVVLLFAAVFLSYLIYSFRPGRRPAAGAAREALPTPPGGADGGQATTVLRGFDYTETVRGKPVFRIQAERTVGFGAAAGLLPDLYALERVALTVYPETGSPVTVHAERATYDQRTREAHLTGNVRWVDGRGALGETEEIAFAPASRNLTAPKPIRLTRGTFVLEARSGLYDVPAHEARLAGPIRGSGAGESTGGLTSFTADRAVYKRDEETVELAGGVTGASNTGSRLAADTLLVKTKDEGRRFEWARAAGHVTGTISGASLTGAARPSTPRAPGAPGGSAPASGAPHSLQTYSGEHAGLLFADDGSIRTLSLTGSPATVDEPSRKLRASSIEVGFESGKARTARATGSVRVDSEGSQAESEMASMALDESGAASSLELSGSVRMSGEGRKGAADRAVEVPDRSVWILTGNPGRSASVEGDGSKITASRIEIDQKRKTLRAEGGARAVLTPKKDGGSLAAPVADRSKPTFAKADRMTFDDATRTATLDGGATLWQEGSSVNGQSITVNDVDRTLAAVGNTRTVFAPAPDAPGKAPAKGAPPKHPSVVTAKRLVYREVPSPDDVKPTPAPGSARPPATLPVVVSSDAGTAAPPPGGEPGTATAHFDGDVIVTSGAWRASSTSATAWLGRDRKLDRVELTGTVSLQDSQEGRTGKAEKTTDWPREGRTVLEGHPAVVVDREGNRVSGATLTISNRGGSVEITAPEGGRTETIHKTGTEKHRSEKTHPE